MYRANNRAVSLLLMVFCTTQLGAVSFPDESIGTWKLRSACPDGKTRHCVVILRREKDVLQGRYIVDGVEKAAKQVRFEQGVLVVQVEGMYRGREYGLTYKGQPAAGRINGTARWTYGWISGTFQFEGEKIAERVGFAD